MSRTAFLKYSIYTSAIRQHRVVSKRWTSPGRAQSDRTPEFDYGLLQKMLRLGVLLFVNYVIDEIEVWLTASIMQLAWFQEGVKTLLWITLGLQNKLLKECYSLQKIWTAMSSV